MNAIPSPRLSVIVAIEHGAENLPLILASLGEAEDEDVEVIVCHPQDWEGLPEAEGLALATVSLECPSDSRVPEMWRDGILRATSPIVALLSAHCVPAQSWLHAAVRQEFEPADAGIGGWFSNTKEAGAMAWAIFILRYVNFSRPRTLDPVHAIAADNALYRRACVLAHPDLLEQGFWEPEFHRRFISDGMKLRLTPALEVIHRNRYTAQEFGRQRRLHGFIFGGQRAGTLSLFRSFVYLLASPVIPAYFFLKIEIASLRMHWLGTAPWRSHLWLARFVCHWVLGETFGVASTIIRRFRR